MNLKECVVSIILSEDGSHALEQIKAGVSKESTTLTALVDETDDLGPWVRVERSDGTHHVLVRWEHVLSLDLPFSGKKNMGLRP